MQSSTANYNRTVKQKAVYFREIASLNESLQYQRTVLTDIANVCREASNRLKLPLPYPFISGRFSLLISSVIKSNRFFQNKIKFSEECVGIC